MVAESDHQKKFFLAEKKIRPEKFLTAEIVHVVIYNTRGKNGRASKLQIY